MHHHKCTIYVSFYSLSGGSLERLLRYNKMFWNMSQRTCNGKKTPPLTPSYSSPIILCGYYFLGLCPFMPVTELQICLSTQIYVFSTKLQEPRRILGYYYLCQAGIIFMTACPLVRLSLCLSEGVLKYYWLDLLEKK